MSEDGLRTNPYVGLRPFFAEDSLYFYGREKQTAELLGILRQHRFLSVVGSSGSGKSSLVRAGLLPGLRGGFLVQDRDRWRTIQVKPGDAPIGNLAQGLLKAMELARTPESTAELEHAIREGHTDAVVRFLTAHLGERDNLFLLVDQFEEIFAFRGADEEAGQESDLTRRKERVRRRAEAADFVDLLLGLAERRELPIYVALTMRTDFLGQCDLFYGLPEALNRGRYLVPRLTREQLRDAVECPALLLGAEIAPRLLDHVLNELGDRDDRLPVLQHALLRTWDAWQRGGSVGPIDLAHYQSAGGLENALNQDAEGALQGLDRDVTARVFKRLVDTDARLRRVRSPARISELMAASATTDRAMVEGIVAQFEKDGRSFVHPSADGKPDDPRVDISHESLIRQWASLTAWVDEERASRDHYKDLVARSRRSERGEVALLRDPELQVVFDWREKARPLPGWAQRYSSADGDFECAMGYLDKSLEVHCVDLAEKELRRRWRWRGRPLTVLIAVALAWLMPQGAMKFLARAGTGETAPASTSMAKVDDLVWTTDDRRTTTIWQEAERYCEELVVPPGADGGPARFAWRLPEVYELRTLSSSQTVDGLGRKLKPEFHDGVTASYLWSKTSPTESPSDPNRYAADFIRGIILPLSVEVADAAAALCVTEEGADYSVNPQGQARTGWVPDYFKIPAPVRVAILNLIFFLTLYYGLSEGGRWLHRKRFFDTILRGLRESGGRPPAKREIKAVERPDAVTALNTVYATTLRRGVASGIDLLLVAFLFLIVVLALLAARVDQLPIRSRITITEPDGNKLEGDFVSRGGNIVTWETDAGETRKLSTARALLQYYGQTGGEPAEAMLPSGKTVEGETFLRQQVIAVEPTGEEWHGTIDEAADSDGTTLLTYSSEDWRQTRDAWATDLRWRFGADESWISRDLAEWVSANPSPLGDATKKRRLQLRAPEVSIVEPPIELAFLTLFLVVGWLYESTQIASRRQATLGMRVAGIIRTDLYGERLSFLRVSARFGYRLFSFLTTCLGWVVQPFTKRRQTLHDRLAGSVVLRRPKPAGRPAEPSKGYTSAVRVLVVGVYVTILFLGYIVFALGTGILGGANADPGSGLWVYQWEGLAVELQIDELTVNGQRVLGSSSDAPPPIPVTLNAEPRVQLGAVLHSRALGRCESGRCPVYYTFGYDFVIDDPSNPDAGNVSKRTVLAESCDSLFARAVGQDQSVPFKLDHTLPALARPGRYELWIDFTKSSACGAAEVGADTAWPRSVQLATIEVK